MKKIIMIATSITTMGFAMNLAAQVNLEVEGYAKIQHPTDLSRNITISQAAEQDIIATGSALNIAAEAGQPIFLNGFGRTGQIFVKGNFGSSADFSVAGAGAVQQWFRINGNTDGTAWALGVNGDQILRSGIMHILQRPGENSDNGITYRNSTDAHKWNSRFNESSNDYSFLYDDVEKAYIQSSDGAYMQPSDRRLKKDITSIGDVLNRLMKLSPSKYHYQDNTDSEDFSIGFIAQEVGSIFPEVVDQSREYQAIAYSKLAVIAIKAIQEQQAIIEELRKELSKVNSDLQALKN